MRAPKFKLGDVVRMRVDGAGGCASGVVAIGPRRPLEGEERWYMLAEPDGGQGIPEKDLVLADAA